jgi:hypothetical protein
MVGIVIIFANWINNISAVRWILVPNCLNVQENINMSIYTNSYITKIQEIALPNKYTKWYCQIVHRAQERAKTKKEAKIITNGYIEGHHIVPECFFINRIRKGPNGWLEGNPNNKENYAYITAQEHFVCHWLLCKMIFGRGRNMVLYAMNGMKRKGKDNIGRYNSEINGRVFQNIKSELAKIQSIASTAMNLERVKNGTHPLMKRLDGTSSAQDRVNAGTHHLLGGEIQRRSAPKRRKEGTYGFQVAEQFAKVCKARDKVISERVTAGTWILQDVDFHKKYVAEQLAQGKHCSQIMKTCQYCGKTIDSANYSKSHGKNCYVFTGVKKKHKSQPRRTLCTCEICGKTMDIGNFKHYNHGPLCKQKPKG